MKASSFIFMLLTITFSASSQHNQLSNAEARQIEGYRLVWSDEFNEGNKPDHNSWNYEEGFVRNRELQWYQQDNVTINNGLLIIEGRREKVDNDRYDAGDSDWRKKRKYAEYTSSSINTRGHHSFEFGIVEVRARIDTASGMWPAIWMLGTNSERGWPANGEIDIMEFYRINGEPTILANAAWAGEEGNVIWNDKKIPFSEFLEMDSKWPEKFHVWKMDWTHDYIRLYLDDRLLNEIDLKQTVNPDGFNPFRQPHYILLNLAIGSNGGDPSGTEFPRKYEVDYVRVYQKIKD